MNLYLYKIPKLFIFYLKFNILQKLIKNYFLIYIFEKIKNLNFKLKKDLKFYIFKIFFICFFITSNNFYCYILNHKNYYIYLSLGKIGYKGPLKQTIDAYEVIGYKFGLILFNLYIYLLKDNYLLKLILIISIKLYKNLRKFFQKFLQTGLRFSYISITYKFAHNGCRQRKKKRI